MIRVPFFLLFSLNQETARKKAKRVLLGYLALGVLGVAWRLGRSWEETIGAPLESDSDHLEKP